MSTPAILETQRPENTGVSTDIVKDALYLDALGRIEGLGNRMLVPLLAAAGGPEALWCADEAFLRAQLPDKKRRAFLAAREKPLDDRWLETHARHHIQVVPYTDARYPTRLKTIYNAPLLLFAKGNLRAMDGKTLGVVGTRQATDYGCRAAEHLIKGLKPANACIISGLAAGIDTVAHWTALHQQLPTVAVFGCGLDIIFPTQNRKLSEAIVAGGGALISEYPLGTPGTKYTYPQRNRIVAGLSDGVLVVEGNIKSGALITARLALEEGRTVYAVPGGIFSPGSEGPNYLIRSGAVPVTEGADISRDQGWETPADSESPQPVQATLGFSPTGTEEAFPASGHSTADGSGLPEPQRQLLALIPENPALPVSVEALQHAVQWPMARLNEVLTLLELEEFIVLLPGAHVCRK